MEYKKLVKIPTIVVEGNIPLPKAMIGIDIEVENHILEAAKEAFSTDGMIYVAMLNSSDRKEIKADSIYEYGVYSKLIQTTKINNSITRFFIDAIDKCKLLDLYEENGAYYSDIEVQIEESIELNKDKITIDAMRSELIDKFYKYLELQNSPQNRDFGNELDLDSLIANISTFVVEDKKKRRQLLKENSFDVRYQILLLHLQYEINKIEIKKSL